MAIRISKNRVQFEGVRLNLARTTVASHATTADIWTTAGNQIDWTGTATTTAFPNAPQGGVERVLICAGACAFTAGVNMLIDGVSSGATVTCAANDQVLVKSVSTTQFKLSRIKYDGTAQVKRRTGTTTSSATPTINTDNVDFYSLTAQAVAITSFTTNLTGTPTENQTLWIAITGTAAIGITWGTSFEAGAVALPITTVTTLRLDVGLVWNTVTSKWRCMASG